MKHGKMQRKRRIVSFEEIVLAIEDGLIIDIFDHPNQEKYSGQKIYAVNYNDYIYLIPFIETDNEIFLKTIIPSRKATKKYLKET
ncbi:MAG: toxin [Bacteroidetes bacterium RIFOXYA12_FULL_35_11]|nr:MAG: toxin [Bacteroidetes bacterium GWF2_35_48]OFY82101.1 MAG: toxin [Bacteroidetes bacterium RIFOXYA12_FULL_35_11]OFY93299.1 MAG: toxin [Bacteroidetes bacterium RIFOXYC12_FULL_35_7]HBX53145.1 toxin [Bacteroidales bacterium]